MCIYILYLHICVHVLCMYTYIWAYSEKHSHGHIGSRYTICIFRFYYIQVVHGLIPVSCLLEERCYWNCWHCPLNIERFPGKLIILTTILPSLNSAVGITQPLSVGEKSSGKEGVRILRGGGENSVLAKRTGGEKGDKIERGSKCTYKYRKRTWRQ